MAMTPTSRPAARRLIGTGSGFARADGRAVDRDAGTVEPASRWTHRPDAPTPPAAYRGGVWVDRCLQCGAWAISVKRRGGRYWRHAPGEVVA